MLPVNYSEISNIAEYELERPAYREAMMALKDRRRVRVGDHLTFLFENRDTVRYQVQEMMRIERIVREHDIRHELESYNELIPGPAELSACLLIEYETPELRGVWLRELLGLENHVWMRTPGHEPVRGRFDTRQISTDRISSVQYVKFPLGASAAAFGPGARLFADHPKYTVSVSLDEARAAELRLDLA